MEVPFSRKLPRVYYPWDPLQLDESIAGSWRPNKNSVLFSQFRGFKLKLWWMPLLQKNSFYAYGDEAEFYRIFNMFIAQNRKHSLESCTFELYLFSKDDRDYDTFALKSDHENFFVHYHYFEESFEYFLDEMIAYRERIRSKTKKSGNWEPPMKRFQLFFLKLDSPTIILINRNRVIREKLIDLMCNSNYERMYLMLFTQNARSIHSDVIYASDYSVFLGKANEDYCRKVLYSDLPVRRYNIGQLVTGVMVHGNFKEVIPLHHLRKVRSQWALSKMEDALEEARIYREFLDSLSDGSEDGNSLID